MAKKNVDWRRLIASGKAVHLIAQEAGVSPAVVVKKAKALGLRPTFLTVEDVVALMGKGMNRLQIARLRGVTHQAVCQFCKRKGLYP